MKINQMPDQPTLEAFLDGSHGDLKVVFNTTYGTFEWVKQDETIRSNPQLPGSFTKANNPITA